LHLLYTIPGIGKTAILSILISAIFAVFDFGVDSFYCRLLFDR